MDTSVTSKGQVTIPKAVRRALGITAGTHVRFVAEGHEARMEVVQRGNPSQIEDGPRILRKGRRVSISHMEVAIRRGAAQK